MSELICPVCGNQSNGTWVDNASVGEYQKGECFKCGHIWNECARDSIDDYERGAE